VVSKECKSVTCGNVTSIFMIFVPQMLPKVGKYRLTPIDYTYFPNTFSVVLPSSLAFPLN
jgi:hypothetical protein